MTRRFSYRIEANEKARRRPCAGGRLAARFSGVKPRRSRGPTIGNPSYNPFGSDLAGGVIDSPMGSLGAEWDRIHGDRLEQ